MKNKNLSPYKRGMKQKNRCFSVLLVIIIIPTIVAGIFLLPENASASNITVDNLIRLTNKERIKNGLKPLKADFTLKNAAEKKAEHLAENEYFAHTSPNGKTFIEWIKDAEYNYLYAGENLAMDFITAEGIVKAWMDSDSHRKNILNSDYTDIAIVSKETIFNNQPTIIVVQMFGRQKDSARQLTISNFNDIINKDSNGETAVLPDCLNYKNVNLFHFKDKNSKIDKIVSATVENRAPYRIARINRDTKHPKIAGEYALQREGETDFANQNILLCLISVIVLLVSARHIRKISYVSAINNIQIHHRI
ncbi:MAG: CAP domain-containing protein [Patescibacteria group bacterium]|nr:CAP domain-containing protein [Patescibacteria group bacterium]